MQKLVVPERNMWGPKGAMLQSKGETPPCELAPTPSLKLPRHMPHLLGSKKKASEQVELVSGQGMGGWAWLHTCGGSALWTPPHPPEKIPSATTLVPDEMQIEGIKLDTV